VAQEPVARIEVRVHPQAKTSRVTGLLGNAYKLDVAAPATDGRANEACLDLLAKISGIHKSQIRLLKGQTSRSKLFELRGITPEDLQRRLNQAI
jgi:uncharacterized protein (TIGR00251 family)